MLYNICYYFLLFLLYAILGWVMEVSISFIYNKKFINRGFLIGPYCPIYGIGVLLIIFLLKNYTANPLVLFVLTMVICMILEYLTSYLMEALFHARWWDYNNKKFNINGRICLETTMPFGLGGLLIIYIINPLLTSWLNKISNNSLIIIGIILMIIFLVDLVLSFLVILKIKTVKVKTIKDNTEDMNKKVKEYLLNNSRWTRRLVTSFPRLKIKLNKYKS